MNLSICTIEYSRIAFYATFIADGLTVRPLLLWCKNDHFSTLITLKDIYKAIDIRGIVARKKNERDWLAAFLKIKIKFSWKTKPFFEMHTGKY
jgi:hypothetical protein